MTSSKSFFTSSGTAMIWFRPKRSGSSFTLVILRLGKRASTGGGVGGGVGSEVEPEAEATRRRVACEIDGGG